MSDNSGWGAVVVVGLLLFAASKCESDTTTESEPFAAAPSREELVEAAAEEAADELYGQSYQEVLGDIGCTSDCSGHDAGFAWAQENGVDDPDVCDGNSDSFIEGCRAYGEEIQRRAEEAAVEAEES